MSDFDRAPDEADALGDGLEGQRGDRPFKHATQVLRQTIGDVLPGFAAVLV
jgi:hypothetical protein